MHQLDASTHPIQREFYDFYRTPRGEFTPASSSPELTTHPTLTSNVKFMNFDMRWYSMPAEKSPWGRSEIGGDPIVVVLTERVSDQHLAGLRKDNVSYIFAGQHTLDLGHALEILNQELGVHPQAGFSMQLQSKTSS